MSEPWTIERLTVLLEQIQAGASPSRIAIVLGGVTRDEVAAKIEAMRAAAAVHTARPAPAPVVTRAAVEAPARVTTVGVWTEEATSYVEEAWKRGDSASEIARALTGFSRNAIIGKVHRLGMKGAARGKPAAPSRVLGVTKPRPAMAPKPRPQPVAPERRVVQERDAHAPVTPIDGTVVPFPGTAKALLDLGPNDCRWPLGPLMEPARPFCGAQAPEGRPYCGRCGSVNAYQAPTKVNSAKVYERSLRRYL